MRRYAFGTDGECSIALESSATTGPTWDVGTVRSSTVHILLNFESRLVNVEKVGVCVLCEYTWLSIIDRANPRKAAKAQASTFIVPWTKSVCQQEI